MAVVSSSTASHLGSMAAKNRISFREDLNEHHCDDDGFESDFSSDDDEQDNSPPTNLDDSDNANSERRELKYRKSLTMLNQLAGDTDSGDDESTRTSKAHLLAAKKSIDDLTAWVREDRRGKSSSVCSG